MGSVLKILRGKVERRGKFIPSDVFGVVGNNENLANVNKKTLKVCREVYSLCTFLKKYLKGMQLQLAIKTGLEISIGNIGLDD